MSLFELENIEDKNYYKDINKTIFIDLLEELNRTKSLIDKEPHKWNNCKKCINDYEYIYSSSFSNKNICTKKPISRSYFKILEIMKLFNIKDYKKVDSLAEAPGGFIEYFNETKCEINAISLISGDKSIPHWNHNIIKNNNLKLHSGIDKTGDIYKILNILNYVKNSGKNSSDIVTGDGGFDYTVNFSNQELDSYRLIYSEVLMGLLLLKDGGIFICKIFDIFYLKTIKLMYILRKSFDKMFIVKPSMSRNTNSEKYIVCIGYKGYDKELINMMLRYFHQELEINIPLKFIKNIHTFNINYVKTQIEEIKRGVNMKVEDIKRFPSDIQIEIGVNWCKRFGLEINRAFFKR